MWGQYRPIGPGSGTVSSGGAGGARTVLQADQNYYVSTIGSDSNPGTVGAPWATLQHALDVIASAVDSAGFNIITNLGVGSFAGACVKNTVGGGFLLIFGAGSGSTTITAGPNDGVFNFGECVDTVLSPISSLISVNKVTMTGKANAATIGHYAVGTIFQLGDPTGVDATDIIFDCSNGPFVLIQASDANIFADFPFNIGSSVGGSAITVIGANATIFAAMFVTEGAFYNLGTVWTITGNLAISGAFAFVQTESRLISSVSPPSGAGVTGQRFSSTIASGINGGGGPGSLGPVYFPGSTPGTTDASSSYDGVPGPLPGVDTQTGSYQLAFTDSDGIIEMNAAGANTVTVPADTTVTFENGTKIWVTQTGAGATTIAGAIGVTVHNAGALSGQWATVKLYKRGTNEWVQTNA